LTVARFTLFSATFTVAAVAPAIAITTTLAPGSILARWGFTFCTIYRCGLILIH
jgi:hypothetical protein